jgi:tetratricopeptide (TPR) repeat protein
MDRLQEPDRSEAMLLLGEALQEQGRMRESTEFLSQVSDHTQPTVLSRRNVLRLYADYRTERHTAERYAHLGAQMLREAELATEPNTRLRALWIAATIFRDRPEAQWIECVWEQLEKEPSTELSSEDKAEYALARALCLYHKGEKVRSLETIEGVIGMLESHGIANSVHLSLLVGLGALHSSLGNYHRAAEAAERGLSAARKLGEERRVRQLAGNLALSHSRLGDIEKQLHWANWAASATASNPDLFDTQQIHSIRARGYAALGRTDEALDALSRAAPPPGVSLPLHLKQSWHLRQADILLLLDKEAEAMRAAKSGVTGDMCNLLSDLYAGPYARWSAKLAAVNGLDLEEGRARLARLLGRMRLLDLMDQAEVLNAKVWLDKQTGGVNQDEARQMWDKLIELPIGATDELKRLGMLDN